MAGKSKNRRGRYKKLISEAVYTLIQGFKTVFQMHGAVCKYHPSCSNYAREAVRELPLHVAVIKIIWRLLRCNPFSRGGFDPVKK